MFCPVCLTSLSVYVHYRAYAMCALYMLEVVESMLCLPAVTRYVLQQLEVIFYAFELLEGVSRSLCSCDLFAGAATSSTRWPIILQKERPNF